MATHRIVSVEMGKLRGRPHQTVVSVQTHNERADVDTHWTLPAVLRAMGAAERFFTQAMNGRQARVQRYTCGQCRAEHIRTHVSDGAIDDLRLHVPTPLR